MKKNLKNKVNKLDLFGVSPKLYIDNQEKYRTKFGVSLSFTLFVSVILACWIYGKDMYYRKNPNIAVSEIINKNPHRFDFTK